MKKCSTATRSGGADSSVANHVVAGVQVEVVAGGLLWLRCSCLQSKGLAMRWESQDHVAQVSGKKVGLVDEVVHVASHL